MKGYSMHDKKILGYNFHVFTTPEGNVCIGAEWGETPEDKEMFDNLVYYNKGIYHGTNEKEVSKKIREWIKNYKAIKLLT